MERSLPPHVGEEKEMLAAFLDYFRATILRKLDGVDEVDLRRRMVPSQTTLLGLVKHLTWVEIWWFHVVMAREDIEPTDPESDWQVESDTTEEVLAFYETTCAESRRIVDGFALDDIVEREGRSRSVRWIMIHMIEETARHCGHADILREMIDGETGDQ